MVDFESERFSYLLDNSRFSYLLDPKGFRILDLWNFWREQFQLALGSERFRGCPFSRNRRRTTDKGEMGITPDKTSGRNNNFLSYFHV